jgi:DNA-binding FadR family transcriptional regulator
MTHKTDSVDAETHSVQSAKRLRSMFSQEILEFAAQLRIAEALERIADSLERQEAS